MPICVILRHAFPLPLLLATAAPILGQQGGLTPGTFVATTMGYSSQPVPAGNAILAVDLFAGTSSPLAVAGFPSAPGEIPMTVEVESRLSFLLGTQFIVGATISNGSVYRVAWTNGGFVASRLNTNPLAEGVSALAVVGNMIWFSTTGLWNSGDPASCKLWSMPRRGGTATMVLDFTAAGATGIWGSIAALGSTLHIFTFSSLFTAGEHWAIDTSVLPVRSTRIGALPASIRPGIAGYPFGALRARWDARSGAFVMSGVWGELLWRDPLGNNVRRRANPSPFNPNTLSDELAGAFALDTDTGAIVWGDKDGHLEQLRTPNAQFQVDYLSLPPLVRNYGLFVMGLDYVPGAARYLPDGPDGCPRSNGEWPINYVSSRPAAGNATFAFTLTSSATAATLLLGFDNVAWAGNLLPYDLGPLGATGCSLGTSAEVIAVTTAPLRIPVHLPNMIATFYTQWGVLDPANALGVVLSDARRMEIR